MEEETLRKLETFSRLVLAAMILVFVFVAAGTYQEMKGLEQSVKNGNCSYLVSSGYVTQKGSLELPENLSSSTGTVSGFSEKEID